MIYKENVAAGFGIACSIVFRMLNHISLPSRLCGLVALALCSIFVGTPALAFGPPYDPIVANCDGPVPAKPTEDDVFIWQDCNDEWHVRGGRSGDSIARLIGNVTSTLGYDQFVGFDLELSDHLDASDSTELAVDFSFVDGGYDGFQFTSPATSELCVDLKVVGNTASAVTRFGAFRTPVAMAVDPTTLLSCGGTAALGLSSPAGGSTLGGSVAQFSFDRGGQVVLQWRLEVGSTPGAADYFDSPLLGSLSSTIVAGLPVDGSTIHATLWYQLSDGSWHSIAYSFQAAPAPTSGGPLSANVFPGACGYGTQQRDWSDADVLFVTNLNDSGPGSLREAMMQVGKRIVVFKVGGTINLNSWFFLQPAQGDLYVAGQTAPGDGIQIIGPPIPQNEGTVFKIRGDSTGSVDNIVLRYLSWRGHKSNATDYGIKGDVLAVQGVTNFVIDHNSLAFSRDEIFGVNSLSCRYPQFGNGIQNNLSFTNNLAAEPFEPHTTVALFTSGLVREDGLGTCPDVTPYNNGVPDGAPYPSFEGARDPWPSSSDFHRLTIHRNVFSAGTHRTPMVGSADTTVTNNISYGTEFGSLILQGNAELDHVGNMFLVHPETVTSPIYGDFMQQRETWTGGSAFDMENANAWFDFPPSIYIDGLYLETAPFVGSVIDPWETDAQGVPVYWEERVGGEENVSSPPDIFSGNWPCDGTDWRCNLNAEREAPLHRSDGAGAGAYACAVQTTPDVALIDEILDEVGNSRRVDCAGNWVLRRQPTDVRQVNNVKQRTDSIGGARPIGAHNGIVYPQQRSITPRGIDEVGGYDVLSGGTVCPDSDGDGMPDAFEVSNGLNTNLDDALFDRDNDGYTNIEEWFNATDP